MSGALALQSSLVKRLIIPLTIGGVSPGYDAVDGSAASQIILTIKNDGTWTITAPGESLTGSPTSGSWLNITGRAGLGNEYELKFTTSNLVNSPSIVNGASAYTAVTSDITLTLSKTSGTASADVLIELRRIGNDNYKVSQSTNLSASGSGGGVVGVSPVGVTIP